MHKHGVTFWQFPLQLLSRHSGTSKVAKRIRRKALMGSNIGIMVNDYTNQQIRSTTIHLQRVVIDTHRCPCVDSYTWIKTTVWNDKEPWLEAIKTKNHGWKRSKWTMEAIKSEIWQLLSMTTFNVSLLHSLIRSNKCNMQQTMGSKESRESCGSKPKLSNGRQDRVFYFNCEDKIGHM